MKNFEYRARGLKAAATRRRRGGFAGAGRKKKPKRRSLVKAYAEQIPAKVFESHKRSVKRVVGRKRGIYVLTKRDRPYYVGIASSLPSRISSHVKNRHAKKWDRFNFYRIDNEKYLKDIESILIRVARPPGNRVKGRFGQNLRKELIDEIVRSQIEIFDIE